jgi:hypothetical protein
MVLHRLIETTVFIGFVRRFYKGQSLRKQTAKMYTREQTRVSSICTFLFPQDIFMKNTALLIGAMLLATIPAMAQMSQTSQDKETRIATRRSKLCGYHLNPACALQARTEIETEDALAEPLAACAIDHPDWTPEDCDKIARGQTKETRIATRAAKLCGDNPNLRKFTKDSCRDLARTEIEAEDGLAEYAKAKRKETEESGAALLNERLMACPKLHPDWTPEDCDKIARRKTWVGMLVPQLIESLGRPLRLVKTKNAEGFVIQMQWLTPEGGYVLARTENSACAPPEGISFDVKYCKVTSITEDN